MQPWSMHSNATGGYFRCNRFIGDENDDGDDDDELPPGGPDALLGDDDDDDDDDDGLDGLDEVLAGLSGGALS